MATMMTASDDDWSQLTWEEELYHGYPDQDADDNDDLVVDRISTIDDDWMTGGAERPCQDDNDDTDYDAGRQTTTSSRIEDSGHRPNGTNNGDIVAAHSHRITEA